MSYDPTVAEVATAQAIHPLGSDARVLLVSVFGPYAQDDAYGSREINPMELYHNQEARPCWSWPDRGKQTSAWLLTLTGLTGPEFMEEWSMVI